MKCRAIIKSFLPGETRDGTPFTRFHLEVLAVEQPLVEGLALIAPLPPGTEIEFQIDTLRWLKNIRVVQTPPPPEQQPDDQ